MSELSEKLLPPISEVDPCGPYIDDSVDLYSEFNQLEQFAAGKEEQVMGDSVIAAVEPSWSKVGEVSRKIFKATKDLRVACYLTQSLMKKSSFVGLAEGLDLIKGLLDDYWEEVHPQLIIDGDDDPDYRLNAISYLGYGSFLNSLSNINVVESKGVGSYTVKNYRTALSGAVDANGNAAQPELSLITAAFMDVGPEVTQGLRTAVSESLDSAQLILAVFSEKLSAHPTPVLDPLVADLKAIIGFYDEILAEQGVGSAQESEDGQSESGDIEAVQSSTKAPGNPGEINSREDVIKQIDMICKYYEKNEPSSPVPLLLNRAKKLVSMDFMDILKDVSPEAVQGILALAGIEA
ncbi:MAG: type VI secretion system protein ImpA [Oleiphilaceae bacterium]|jgi:type VI secretion system protein ImpA